MIATHKEILSLEPKLKGLLRLIWLGLAAALLAACIALFWSRVRIAVHFTRKKDNDQFIADIRAVYGLIKFRFHVPTIQFAGWEKGLMIKMKKINKTVSDQASDDKIHIDGQKIIRMYKRGRLMIDNIKGFGEWILRFLAHVRCTQLQWRTEIGLGDAPETAITTGIIWGIKSSMLAFLLKHIQLKTKPELAVQPQFAAAHFSTALHCIVEIRLGYAISAGLLLLVRILKVKGGVKTWQNILFKA